MAGQRTHPSAAMRLGSRYPYQQPIFEHDYQPGTVPSLHVEYGCTRHSPDIGPHIHEPLRHLRHAGHLYDNQCHVAGNMERLCTKKHRTPIFRDAERPVAIPHGSNRNNNGDLRVDPKHYQPLHVPRMQTALAILLYATIMWAGKSVIFKESIRYILKRESK